MRLPDPGTVRGAITAEILKYRELLVPPVLETGALRPANAWWRDWRTMLDYRGEWIGIDIETGLGVDVVADLCDPIYPLPLCEYSSVLCAETLEHVKDPHRALRNLEMALKGGGWILVTVPFAFPVHNYPDDYWRFTPSGLRMLLEDAGFWNVETYGFNEFTMDLRDHDANGRIVKTPCPMHVFGMGRCP